MKLPLMVIVRLTAFILSIFAVHWVDSFIPLYFVVLAGVALIMLFSLAMDIPGCDFLSRFETSDRLAIWIVLVTLAVIGYLHNTNTWTAEGYLNRPQDISRWKTELILGISIAVPLIHWVAGLAFPRVITMNGKRFATEFALYVNFSGIALVLWSGEAVLSLLTLGAALALMVMAELTLYASQ